MKWISLISLLLLFIQCKNAAIERKVLLIERKNESGQPVFRIYKLKNDSVDKEVDYYYQNNIRKQVCYSKNGLQHGPDSIFYRNGKIALEGNWYNGKKSGAFRYYDSLGNLNAIRNFISLHDTNIAMMNEVVRFSSAGDTLKDGSFYLIKKVEKDTIKWGDPFQMSVSLPTPFYDKAMICLGDFNEQYQLAPGTECDSIPMRNYEISFSKVKYTKGVNIIRGLVLNYKNYKKPNGNDAVRIRRIFFEQRFYVVP